MVNKSEAQPQLSLTVIDNIPDILFVKEQEILQELDQLGIPTKYSRRPNEPWATFEWFIPGLIVLYIAKPYIDSFFSEVGKHHSKLLLNLLQNLLNKAKSIETRTIVATSSSKKLQSRPFSINKTLTIYLRITDSVTVKVLLDNEYTINQYNTQISVLLDQIKEFSLNQDKNTIIEDLATQNIDSSREIYAVYEESIERWLFLTRKSLFKLHQYVQENSSDLEKT